MPNKLPAKFRIHYPRWDLPTLKAGDARNTTIPETRGKEAPADLPPSQRDAFEYHLFRRTDVLVASNNRLVLCQPSGGTRQRRRVGTGFFRPIAVIMVRTAGIRPPRRIRLMKAFKT